MSYRHFFAALCSIVLEPPHGENRAKIVNYVLNIDVELVDKTEYGLLQGIWVFLT